MSKKKPFPFNKSDIVEEIKKQLAHTNIWTSRDTKWTSVAIKPERKQIMWPHFLGPNPPYPTIGDSEIDVPADDMTCTSESTITGPPITKESIIKEYNRMKRALKHFVILVPPGGKDKFLDDITIYGGPRRRRQVEAMCYIYESITVEDNQFHVIDLEPTKI